MSELKIDCIIGIDPGAQGGIAVYRPGMNLVVARMPKDVRDLLDMFDYYSGTFRPVVFLEKIQVRPDDATVENGSVNMGKLYRIQKMLANFEHLKATIELSGIPYCLVHPLTWQSRLGLRHPGEEKSARKKRYRDIASDMHPETKISLWNCDAVLLMEFGRKMMADEKGRKWVFSNLPKREHSKLF